MLPVYPTLVGGPLIFIVHILATSTPGVGQISEAHALSWFQREYESEN